MPPSGHMRSRQISRHYTSRHSPNHGGRLVLHHNLAARLSYCRLQPRVPSVPIPVSTTASTFCPRRAPPSGKAHPPPGRQEFSCGPGLGQAQIQFPVAPPSCDSRRAQSRLGLSPAFRLPPSPTFSLVSALRRAASSRVNMRGHVLHDHDRHGKIRGSWGIIRPARLDRRSRWRSLPGRPAPGAQARRGKRRSQGAEEERRARRTAL